MGHMTLHFEPQMYLIARGADEALSMQLDNFKPDLIFRRK